MYNGNVFVERKILRVPFLGRSIMYMPALAMPLTLAFDRQVLVGVIWDGAARCSLENPHIHLRDIGPQVNALEHWIPIVSVLMFFMYCSVQ